MLFRLVGKQVTLLIFLFFFLFFIFCLFPYLFFLFLFFLFLTLPVLFFFFFIFSEFLFPFSDFFFLPFFFSLVVSLSPFFFSFPSSCLLHPPIQTTNPSILFKILLHHITFIQAILSFCWFRFHSMVLDSTIGNDPLLLPFLPKINLRSSMARSHNLPTLTLISNPGKG